MRLFTQAFVQRWGSRFNLYGERADAVASLQNVYDVGRGKNTAFSEANAHIVNSMGSCGVVTSKLLKDCYDFCDFSKLPGDATRCYGWILNTLTATPQAHELVGLTMLKPSEIPSIAFSKKQNTDFNTIAAALDTADNTFSWATKDLRSTCITAYYQDYGVQNVCVDSIQSDPWVYNPFMDRMRTDAGEYASWCLVERQRLRLRGEDTNAWEAICCDLPYVPKDAPLTSFATKDSIARDAYTGYESWTQDTPPHPPSSPPAPPSSPAPPHPTRAAGASPPLMHPHLFSSPASTRWSTPPIGREDSKMHHTAFRTHTFSACRPPPKSICKCRVPDFCLSVRMKYHFCHHRR